MPDFVSDGKWWRDLAYFLPRNWRMAAAFTVLATLGFVLPLWIHVQGFRGHGRQAMAQVRDVHHGYRSCAYTYTYQLDGHTYSGSEHTCGAVHAMEGEALAPENLILITYDPAAPWHSIGGPLNDWYALIERMLVLIPLLGCLIVLADFVNWRRKLKGV